MTEARKIGVTGTDTGVGKTIVSCALAAHAVRKGVSVGVMKPVESGITTRLDASGIPLRSDAERLREAAGAGVPLDLVRPYGFLEPLAPFMAARRAGIHIDISKLDSAQRELARDRDLLIVEGAGGLLVPLTEELSFAQLFSRWSCELLIVAGNRLGVLNHLLLTINVARRSGLRVLGVVLTSLVDTDASIAEATNYDALRILIPDIPLYRFPWIDRIDDPDALAIAFDASGLNAILDEEQSNTPTGPGPA